jgi:hypothetical protein
MKYTNTTGTILEMEPGTEKNQFTMEINAKSFSVLSEGIYENKIRAIIREYYINGLDSHNEAGVDKLVDVHLPSSQEPYFYVQDYGIGLDDEDVLNVYTRFFASTKDQTNRYTGSLGIGACCFMSYHTKSCTIEAVKNNKKIIYNCFLEKGIPSYTKMGEFETEECNGVKIQLPVQNRDFTSFNNEAINVFRWCSKKPNFIGVQVKIEKAKRIFEGNGWYFSNGSCFLLMGNIGYPIEVGESGLEKYKNFISSGLVLEARLGQVEFSASREGLSYTPKTVAFLQKKFGEIKEELAKKVEEKIVNSKSFYQASCNANEIHNALPYTLRNIININSVKFNGKGLKNDIQPTIDGVSVVKYEYCNWRSPKKKDYKVGINYNSSQLVEVDIKRGQHQKGKEYCSDNKKDVYLVTFDTEKNPKCKQEFKELVGCENFDFIPASSIQHTKTKPSLSNKNSLTDVMVYTGDGRATLSWRASSIDINKEKGTYVIRTGYQYYDNLYAENKSSSQISVYLSKLGEYSIKEFPVYAIKKKDEEKFIKAGWVELKDKLKSVVTNKGNKIVEELSVIYTHLDTSQRNFLENTTKIQDFLYLRDKYSKIQKYSGYRNNINGFLPKILGDDLIKKVDELKAERLKEFESFLNELNLLIKKYPLLAVNFYGQDKSELVYYYKGKNV